MPVHRIFKEPTYTKMPKSATPVLEMLQARQEIIQDIQGSHCHFWELKTTALKTTRNIYFAP